MHKNRSPKRKISDISLLSTRANVPSYVSKGSDHSISILMLQSFLSDTVKGISQSSNVSNAVYSQLPAMKNILNDCMALSNISLEFYTEVESALNLIRKAYEYSCETLVPEIVTLLGKIFGKIVGREYVSDHVSVRYRKNKGNSLEDCLVELKVRINRVNVRMVNIWRNILSPIKELEKVCYGFLRFFCEADSMIPRIGLADPVTTCYRYCRNPGYVVQTIRKTVVFLDSELISLRACREIHEIIEKYPPEIIACIDKTMSGFVIWDLIRSALEYYKQYAAFHYKIDIFDKNLVLDDLVNGKDPILTDRDAPRTRINRHKSIPVIKDFSSPEKTPNLKRRKESSCERVLDYEIYVSERFREFLIEKMKRSGQDLESSFKCNKGEILEEFNQYIELLEHEKIVNLWKEENLTFETSRLGIYN